MWDEEDCIWHENNEGHWDTCPAKKEFPCKKDGCRMHMEMPDGHTGLPFKTNRDQIKELFDL